MCLSFFKPEKLGTTRVESTLNYNNSSDYYVHRVAECYRAVGERKQQRRGRLRKRHLKSDCWLQYKLYDALYSLVIRQINYMLAMFLELNSKGLHQSSGKEKESCFLFPSSTKREIRHFHIVVVQ